MWSHYWDDQSQNHITQSEIDHLVNLSRNRRNWKDQVVYRDQDIKRTYEQSNEQYAQNSLIQIYMVGPYTTNIYAFKLKFGTGNRHKFRSLYKKFQKLITTETLVIRSAKKKEHSIKSRFYKFNAIFPASVIANLQFFFIDFGK